MHCKLWVYCNLKIGNLWAGTVGWPQGGKQNFDIKGRTEFPVLNIFKAGGDCQISYAFIITMLINRFIITWRYFTFSWFMLHNVSNRNSTSLQVILDENNERSSRYMFGTSFTYRRQRNSTLSTDHLLLKHMGPTLSE